MCFRGPANVARTLDESEALVALATFAYEHLNDPFPEVVEPGPCFEADGLGHPLLAADRCVRNDLRLGPDLRLLVVSGSNMSGKSTLLRTVGANAVLALAGAPVRAGRLRFPFGHMVYVTQLDEFYWWENHLPVPLYVALRDIDGRLKGHEQ